MEPEVEVIQFRPPGPTTTLRLPLVLAPPDMEEPQVREALYKNFSQFGLLHRLHLGQGEEGTYFAYVQYYSQRAASAARQATRPRPGSISLKVEGGLEIRLASGFSADRTMETQMLARQKCEALANYYLGFNGWSGKVQYHRQEEVEEGKVKVVSIARLDFPQAGLHCEGAGMAEAEVPSLEQRAKVMAEVGKKARGEAVVAAWSRVVLVIVGGSKVMVEVNTTKEDSFHYDPLWDEPVVTVREADYKDWVEEVEELKGE